MLLNHHGRAALLLIYAATATTALISCGPDESPTGPEKITETPNAAELAVAGGSWTAKAAFPGSDLFGFSAGVAPNSAGQSVLYALGGTDGEGGTGFRVQAYNVATDTWTGRLSNVGVFNSNGVGKIGSKLYFSGGFNAVETPPSFTNLVWAYDYSHDRMIRKADLPIFGAQGVTGVIDAKLYVLPGSCSGDRYPNPGYCAEEPTRRFFRYDPVTNAWISRASSPHFHKSGAAGVLNGKFYVAGGFNGFQAVAALDVYDPATNSWRTLAPLPTAGQAIGAVLGSQFLVISGSGGELHTYAYSPGTNTWKLKASPTWGHGAVARVTLDGHSYLLAVGGGHGPNSDIPNDSELFTP